VGHARLSQVEGTSYIRTDEDKPRGINQQLCKSLNLITLSVVSLSGGPGLPFSEFSGAASASVADTNALTQAFAGALLVGLGVQRRLAVEQNNHQ